MSIVCRFAPSPTGYLHIGGARTALFNWLFAQHMGGKFLLRVEDTDLKRSTDEAKDAIITGLKWLGLNWNDEITFQSQEIEKHKKIALELLDKDLAYYCYCTPEELQALREKAQSEGKVWKYDRRWRNRSPDEAPEGIKPVLRFKAPIDGQTKIKDIVQGEVTIDNNQLDDMILLRADGTPTYMLSVVVDDHNMGVTHIIRGDDHLNNAFRQYHLYKALNWNIPEFAHIPLIHGPDGAKLSKRHGALGVEAYKEMGYLPEALRNYLLRLGWSHGDEEIFSTEQAIKLFSLKNIGKSPARMDYDKLDHINGYYIRHSQNKTLIPLLKEAFTQNLTDTHLKRLEIGLDGLKERAKTLKLLAELCQFYINDVPLPINDQAKKHLNTENISTLKSLKNHLDHITEWSEEELEKIIKAYANENDIKFKNIAQPLRAALTGTNTSPGIYEVMNVLGKQECLDRIGYIVENKTD